MSGEIQNAKKNVLETEFAYDKDHTFDERLAETKKALENYAGRIPVLVQMRKGSKLPNFKSCKFLVPGEITIGQFLMIIRKRIPNLTPEQAVWIFVNGILPPSSQSIGSVYHSYKSKDGFLRIVCAEENVFG